MNVAYIWLMGMMVLTVAGQLMVKQGAKVWPPKALSDLLKKEALPLWVGFGLAFAAPVFYLMALRTLPLGEAFSFTSINYILVMLAGKYFLREPLNLTQILGGVLVVVGVVCISLG